jgi:hypothetical protein
MRKIDAVSQKSHHWSRLPISECDISIPHLLVRPWIYLVGKQMNSDLKPEIRLKR